MYLFILAPKDSFSNYGQTAFPDWPLNQGSVSVNTLVPQFKKQKVGGGQSGRANCP